MVVDYNPKIKSYRLVNAINAMIKDKILRIHLKVIYGVDNSAGTEYSEVKRALNHKGSPGNHKYYMEWKGRSKSWIYTSNF